MFLFKFFLTLALFQSLSVQAAISDKLVARVDRTFVFQSEINQVIKSFQMMDCLMGGSTIKEKFGLSEIFKKPIPNQWTTDQELSKKLVKIYLLHQILRLESQNKFQIPFLEKLMMPNLSLCKVPKFSELDALTLSLIQCELHFQEFYSFAENEKTSKTNSSSFGLSLSYKNLYDRLKAFQIQYYH